MPARDPEADLHRYPRRAREACSGSSTACRSTAHGAAGLRRDNDNLPPTDPEWWQGHRDRLERLAREVGGR